MKTLQLIQLLTTGERKEFAHQLELSKNKKLGEAFTFLSTEKSKSDLDLQEQLFRKLFKKAWTKKDDYLLRNELRLLNRQLELYMASKRFDQANRRYDAEASWLFMTSLLDREAWALYEKEWDAEFRRCETDGNMRSIVRLRELDVEFRVRRRDFSGAGIEGFRQALVALQLDATRLHKFRMLEARLYQTQLNRQVFERDSSLVLSEVPLPTFEINEETDPYLGYLENMRLANENRGKNALQYLLKASQFIEKCKPGVANVRHSQALLYAQIALENFLQYDYAEAHTWYEKAIGSIDVIVELHHQCTIYLNYISNLTRMHKYADVLSFIEKHYKLLYNLKEIRERVVCVQTMCLIYGNKIKEAKTLIQEHIAEAREDTLMYLRLTLAIIFYLQNKYDMVSRELLNLQQSLRSIGARYESICACARLFSRFADMQAVENSSRSKQLLVKDIQKYYQEHQPHFEILPVRWMLNQLEEGLEITITK
ncbi:MAG: hypothetical protein ACRCYO_10515 [Bacteroidia bacterium]